MRKFATNAFVDDSVYPLDARETTASSSISARVSNAMTFMRATIVIAGFPSRRTQSQPVKGGMVKCDEVTVFGSRAGTVKLCSLVV